MSVSTEGVAPTSSNVLEASEESEQANYRLDLISINNTEASNFFRDAKWVLPGEHIEIAGFDINCGMIYVGRHLPGDYHTTEDPCLIDPTLRVNRICFNRTGKYQGPGTSSYRKMSATRKSAYLEWLSNGRCNVKAYIGFVFQFLYGLEYRVLRELEESRRDDGIVSELTQIREEVERLQNIYGNISTTFKEYASRFLDICDLLRKSDSIYKAKPSLAGNLDTELCWHFNLRLKVALAQMAKKKQPVSIDWLFAWWFNVRRVRQSYIYDTDRFRELIRQRYTEKHGEGIVIEPGTNPLIVIYRTANSGFLNSEAHLIVKGLTNTSFSEKVFYTIQTLVNECTLEAEACIKQERYYQEADKGLPPDPIREDIPGLKKWLTKIVRSNHCGNVSVKALLEGCSMPSLQKVSNYQLVNACQALENLGYGVKPDILSQRDTLKESSHVVLFRLCRKDKALPSRKVIVATLQPATEPVTVRTASSVNRGFTIPAPITDDKSKEEATTGFDLDITAVQRKQDESAKASALLSDIFEEDEDNMSGSILENKRSNEPEDSVLGLDTLHTEFLKILARQPSWSRDALASKASELDLLLDGALEVINNAAFDVCDEPLTDSDDPIELDIHVLEQLLS